MSPFDNSRTVGLQRTPLVDAFPSAAVPGNRLAFIDVLRAVAILLVFVRHATEVYAPYGHGNRFVAALAEQLNFGALGVTIFFAISGFLIPSSLHGPKLQGTIRYVVSRVFRLYPAFLVSIIPSAAAHFWLSGKTFPFSQVLLNCTMLPRLFGGVLANGAYWTLEVEAAFYLICLVLFLGGVLSQAFSLGLVCLVTFLVFQSSQQTFFDGIFNPVLTGPALFFNMDIAVMCWGAMARAWWSGTRLNAATAAIFWGFAAFWVVWRPLVLLRAVISHHAGTIDTRIIAAFGLGTAIFLAALLHGRLRNRALLHLGRISYSFYLLHGVAIHLLRAQLDAYPWLKGYHAGLYALLALALSLAFAEISFRCVEQPGIRLGRRLAAATCRRIDTVRTGPGSVMGRAAALLAPLSARPSAARALALQTLDSGAGESRHRPAA